MPDGTHSPAADQAALTGRLGREFTTMRHMVGLYCQAHHAGQPAEPCPQCAEFLVYAARRLEKCPYGQDKPTCGKCPIHCYKKAPREYAKQVMRYAGPRMMKRHPYLALMHLIDGRRKAVHPMELRRR